MYYYKHWLALILVGFFHLRPIKSALRDQPQYICTEVNSQGKNLNVFIQGKVSRKEINKIRNIAKDIKEPLIIESIIAGFNVLSQNNKYQMKIYETSDGYTVVLICDDLYTISDIEIVFDRISWYDQYKIYIETLLTNAGVKANQSYSLSTLKNLLKSLLYDVRSNLNTHIDIDVRSELEKDMTIKLKLVFLNQFPTKINSIRIYNNGDSNINHKIEAEVAKVIKPQPLWNNINKITILDLIVALYQEHGYHDVTIDSFSAILSPDRRRVDFSISVNEGICYTVEEVVVTFSNDVDGLDTLELKKIHDGFVRSNQLVGSPLYEKQIRNYLQYYVTLLETKYDIFVLESDYLLEKIDSQVRIIFNIKNAKSLPIINSLQVKTDFNPLFYKKLFLELMPINHEGQILYSPASAKKFTSFLVFPPLYENRNFIQVKKRNEDKVDLVIQLNRISVGKISGEVSTSSNDIQIQFSYDDVGKVFKPDAISKLLCGINTKDVFASFKQQVALGQISLDVNKTLPSNPDQDTTSLSVSITQDLIKDIQLRNKGSFDAKSLQQLILSKQRNFSPASFSESVIVRTNLDGTVSSSSIISNRVRTKNNLRLDNKVGFTTINSNQSSFNKVGVISGIELDNTINFQVGSSNLKFACNLGAQEFTGDNLSLLETIRPSRVLGRESSVLPGVSILLQTKTVLGDIVESQRLSYANRYIKLASTLQVPITGRERVLSTREDCHVELGINLLYSYATPNLIDDVVDLLRKSKLETESNVSGNNTLFTSFFSYLFTDTTITYQENPDAILYGRFGVKIPVKQLGANIQFGLGLPIYDKIDSDSYKPYFKVSFLT